MKRFHTYRWLIFGMIGVLYFLVHLQRLAPTVIARDLALSFSADAMLLGVIASSYFYLYALAQPVVGYLSDTAGPRKVIAFSFLLTSLGTLLFALAPSATVATAGRALVGFGAGGVFIPGLKIFSRWYRVDEFAVLTGLMLTIGGLGGLSSALPLTYLVLATGWRMAFVGIGLLSLLLALACWLVIRDSPEEKGWPPVPTVGLSQPVPGEGEMPMAQRLKMIFRSFNFWMITLSTFFTGAVMITFQGLWAVPYLMDVFHVNRVIAGTTLMLIPLGFALGGPTLGWVAQRLGMDPKRVVIWTLLLGLAGWLTLIFLQDKGLYWLVFPLFFFFGLAGGGTTPILFAITRDLFPPSLMGTATGLMNMAAFLGTALYQPLTGFMLQQFPAIQAGEYPVAAYRVLMAFFFLSYGTAILATGLLKRKPPPAAG